MRPSHWRSLTALYTSTERETSPGPTFPQWTRWRYSRGRRTGSPWSRPTARGSTAPTFYTTSPSILKSVVTGLLVYFTSLLNLQVCYVHMVLKQFDQQTARLIPDKIKMELELELSMYSISEWDLVYFADGQVYFYDYYNCFLYSGIKYY